MPDVIFKIRGEPAIKPPRELEFYLSKDKSTGSVVLRVMDNITNTDWGICEIQTDGYMKLWEALTTNIGLRTNYNNQIKVIDNK